MRYTQPQGRARIDWGNPVTRGIDIAFTRLDEPSLVGGYRLNRGGSASFVTQKYGVGWYFGNSTADDFTLGSIPLPVLSVGSEYTYLLVLQPDATAGSDYLLRTTGGGVDSFSAQISGLFHNPLAVFSNSSGTAVTVNSSAGIPAGTAGGFVARAGGGIGSVFLNGRQTGAAALTGSTNQQNGTFRVGNSFSTNFRGSIGLVVRWPRALTDAEACAVSANPWLLFRQTGQRVPLALLLPRFAALSAPLAPISISTAASILVAAALARVLGAAGVTATGTVPAGATVAKLLDTATASTTASVPAGAALLATLGAAAAGGAGSSTLAALLDALFGPATATSVATLPVAALLDARLGRLTTDSSPPTLAEGATRVLRRPHTARVMRK
jgi:hypothetical protein